VLVYRIKNVKNLLIISKIYFLNKKLDYLKNKRYKKIFKLKAGYFFHFLTKLIIIQFINLNNYEN